MARTAYSGTLDVEPTAAPPDRAYQNIQANPQAFGAAVGEGLQTLGQGALAAGKFYGEVAADDATNKWQEEVNKILYGSGQVGADGNPDRGYYGLRGEDAMRAMPEVQQKILQLRTRYREGMASSEQQLHFDHNTRAMSQFLAKETSHHYSTQFDHYTAATNKASADLALGFATSHAADDEQFEHGVADLISARMKDAQRQYGGNPGTAIIDDVMLNARREATAARIEAMLPTNPTRAKQILDQDANLLRGPLYDKLSNQLRTRGVAVEAANMLREAQGRPLSTGGGLRSGVGGAVATRISQEASRQGVDNGLALTTAHIESSMGQNLGSRGNIFQLGRPEWASVGGGDMADTETQVRNGVSFLGRTKQQIEDALGRPASDADVYLAHQQGVAGAKALLTAPPGTPAGSVVDPKNISANGGDPNAPASAFVSMWRNKYAATARQVGAPAAASAAPGTFDLAAGDSIAYGSQKFGGLGGKGAGRVADPEGALAHAAGGRNPQQGLDFIRTHPEEFQGKTVFWSSGLMNAGANPQAALPLVGEQLDALKAAGANVVLAGVDTGKFAQYNPALAAIADEKGVPFAGPLPTNDVHPGPAGYKQYADAAAKLIQPAGTPDQVAAPRATPVPAAPQDPASQPPGMAELANAEAELARNHARTIANLADNPRGAENPEAYQRAIQQAQTQFHARQTALTAQKQAITEARAASADGYTQRMLKGQVDPSIIQQVADDPHLDAESRIKLQSFYNSLVNKPMPSAAVSHAGAAELLNRIRLPDSDPARITDTKPLYDAVIAGQIDKGDFEFTMREFNNIRAPGGETLARVKNDFLNGMKSEIDRSGVLPGLPNDGRGRRKFYEFQHYVDRRVGEMRDSKKSPFDLFDPEKPDYLGKPEALKPYRRSMTEAMSDFTTDMGGGVQATSAFGAAPVFDPSKVNSLADLQAAVKKDPSLRDRAVGIALQKGWIRPDAPVEPELRPPLAR